MESSADILSQVKWPDLSPWDMNQAKRFSGYKDHKGIHIYFQVLTEKCNIRQNQDDCISLEKFEKLAIGRTMYQKCVMPSGEQVSYDLAKKPI